MSFSFKKMRFVSLQLHMFFWFCLMVKVAELFYILITTFLYFKFSFKRLISDGLGQNIFHTSNSFIKHLTCFLQSNGR